jgi:hypothetical protein
VRQRSVLSVRRSPIAAVALALVFAVAPPAFALQQSTGIEIANGDVYVVDGGVLKNPTSSTPTSTQLTNVVGTPLGITWGAWEGATGSATARRTRDDRVDVRVGLQGLVPRGVYSLFYLTTGPDSANPMCPTEERLVALRSVFADQLPDRSSFTADDAGAAAFHAKAPLRSHILTAAQVVIVAIYHANGATYGAVPNAGEAAECRSSFGSDAMRQLLIIQRQL